MVGKPLGFLAERLTGRQVRTYYDTGILLKLYTAEPESEAVERFVRLRAERLEITDLHIAECFSALRLKEFRKECTGEQAGLAIDLIKGDMRAGILHMLAVDWDRVWQECRLLSDKYGSRIGARTLDTLHVATARTLGANEFLTSDRRQADLALAIGLAVFNPAGQ
jgi:predicted nucleic acid-binding protein